MYEVLEQAMDSRPYGVVETTFARLRMLPCASIPRFAAFKARVAARMNAAAETFEPGLKVLADLG